MKTYNNQLTNKSNRLYYDPFFDEFFNLPVFNDDFHVGQSMKTDITETQDSYLLSTELPGFKKENINLDLENGYLTISANKESNSEENNKYIRHERRFESCKRRFYVGENVSHEDVSANMEDGVLKIKIQKRVEEAPKAKRIEIQ